MNCGFIRKTAATAAAVTVALLGAAAAYALAGDTIANSKVVTLGRTYTEITNNRAPDDHNERYAFYRVAAAAGDTIVINWQDLTSYHQHHVALWAGGTNDYNLSSHYPLSDVWPDGRGYGHLVYKVSNRSVYVFAIRVPAGDDSPVAGEVHFAVHVVHPPKSKKKL
jgi:hypothetical protein